MKLNSDFTIGQSVIDEIPTSKIERHKELLFGLFLFEESEESDSEYTDTPSGFMNLKRRLLSPSQYAVDNMKTESDQMASPLSSLPELVRSYSIQTKVEKIRNNLLASSVDSKKGNHRSFSVELKEVEEFGIKKFRKHIIPKLNSHDLPINQYHDNFQQCKKVNSSSRTNDLKIKDSLDDKMLSSSPVPTFSPFTIKFNECSLFAISHWAAKSSFPRDFVEKKNKVTREFYPTPDVSLRKCNICNRWGHYDIECDNMKKSDVFYFSNLLRNQSIDFANYDNHSSVQQPTNAMEEVSHKSENDKGCFICTKDVDIRTRLQCTKCKNQCHIGCVELSFTIFLQGGFICSICSEYEERAESSTIESCGMFIFEQSTDVLPEDSGDKSFINDSQSVAGSEEVRVNGSNLSLDRNLLTPNNLCWAKRGNALPGSLGREKWWPGMIVHAFDTTGRNRSQGDKYYVVRFFCCQGGGRVRATEVIPFIPNFDSIWNDRLAHPEEPDYEYFIKALKEASTVSDWSFPTNPPKKSAEKRKFNRTVSELSLTSSIDVTSNHDNDSKYDKPIPIDWEGAEVSEEDGIIILAKSDGENNPNDVENGEESSQGQSSIAAMVKQFSKQSKEIEITSILTDNCLSLPNDELLGIVVCWFVLASSSEESVDSYTASVNHSKVQCGKVVAVSMTNNKALVRTMARTDALAHFPLQMRTSINYNDSDDIKTMWVTLKELKQIKPDLDNISFNNVAASSQPPRGVKRSISADESVNRKQDNYVTRSESSRRKTFDGKWKRDSDDRTSSTMSSTPSVQDTLHKSLAKLKNSGIYQADKILNDRTIKLGGRTIRQYQIKWDGVNEITWEPEDHIFDSNLLRVYHENKELKSAEKEKKDYSKPETTRDRGKYKSVKNLCCPFCGVRCKDGQSLGGHIKMHKNEPNYKKILESGRPLTTPSAPKEDEKKNDINEKKVAAAPQSVIANVKEFKCYFCGEICKDAPQYGGHVRKHVNEPNYRAILDEAKKDRDEAYDALKTQT